MSEFRPQNDTALFSTPATQAAAQDVERFIPRVYNHVMGAIVLLIALEVWYFKTDLAYTMASAMLGVNWLMVLGAFMVVGWLARGAAHRAHSLRTQYLALAGYVVAESIILVPMLVIAEYRAPGTITSAGLLTLLGFAGLTAIAFRSRRDFTMYTALLQWAGVLALVAIVGSVVFGMHLGTWFSVLMVGVAGLAILRDTSAIIHHYPSDRYVAAALELFASVALMFWYLLRLLSGRR